MMRTRDQRISVNAQSMQLLSKSLEPMPDKWHGVRTFETRYRRRYVDLMINPKVRESSLSSGMVQAIREYLDGAGFIEVDAGPAADLRRRSGAPLYHPTQPAQAGSFLRIASNCI